LTSNVFRPERFSQRTNRVLFKPLLNLLLPALYKGGVGAVRWVGIGWSGIELFAAIRNAKSIACTVATTNMQRIYVAEPETVASANSLGSRSSRVSVSSSSNLKTIF
jgi:hypothetical protein